VSEWLKEPVSKTGRPVWVSWVRIPPSPYCHPLESPSSSPLVQLSPSRFQISEAGWAESGTFEYIVRMPNTSMPSKLCSFPVVIEIPVQWGELDAYGHVNNTVFFRYFESARVEYLERCGFLSAYHERKIGAILHSTNCRFRQPLHYPDSVWVGTRAVKVSEDRFTMEYLVVSQGTRSVIAQGEGVVVSFDYTSRKKVPLPPEVVRGIEELASDHGGSQ
jgi:acyl-CoA thioester hydrolase